MISSRQQAAPASRGGAVAPRLGPLGLLGGLMVAALGSAGSAAAPQDSGAAASQGTTEVRETRLTEMRRRIGMVSLKFSDHTPELIETPLHRFDDPARDFHDGTLWCWISGKRPVALVSIERYEAFWAYELIAADRGPLSAGCPGGLAWRPDGSGPASGAFPDAADPSPTAAGRLTQLKRRAAQVEVSTESLSGDRIRLRLLPRPVFRYNDDAHGLTDGAVFLFASGTNPEAALIVESLSADEDRSRWTWTFLPITAAGLRGTIDGREVWRKEPAVNWEPQSPYTGFRVDFE